MDEDYQQWLQEQLSESGIASSGYKEVSVQELLKLIKAVPLPEDNGGEGWKQVMDYQVLPISLNQYWEAFYADGCPYQL